MFTQRLLTCNVYAQHSVRVNNSTADRIVPVKQDDLRGLKTHSGSSFLDMMMNSAPAYVDMPYMA
jgi:hypothetical protein